MTLSYQTFSQEEILVRVIEPVGLFYENNYWYVMGYCHLRKDYRQFRTDRMSKISRTTIPFTLEHISVEEFRNPKELSTKTKVVIRMNKENVKYIKAGRKYYGFVSEEDRGDKVDMLFMSSDLQCGLARWYLMFGDSAEIIEPEIFKDYVNEMMNKIKANLN